MVAFTHLIVLATAGFSAVSAVSFSKRNVTDDVVAIQAALDLVKTDLTNINAQDPTTATTLTTDMNSLIQVIDNSAIGEEGQAQLSTIPDVFDGIFDGLADVVTAMEKEIPTIQTVPGLSGTLQNEVGTLMTVVSAYVEAIISIEPDADKSISVTILLQILANLEQLDQELGQAASSQAQR